MQTRSLTYPTKILSDYFKKKYKMQTNKTKRNIKPKHISKTNNK